jgi:hypothetical protein
MEDILLGQARGLLILANAHKSESNSRLYSYYLNRAMQILNTVQKLRECNEQVAA